MCRGLIFNLASLDIIQWLQKVLISIQIVHTLCCSIHFTLKGFFALHSTLNNIKMKRWHLHHIFALESLITLAAVTATVLLGWVPTSFVHLELGVYIVLSGRYSQVPSNWKGNVCELPFSGLSTEVLLGLSLGFDWTTQGQSRDLPWLHASSCCYAERWSTAPVWGHVHSGAAFLQRPLCIWLHSFFPQFWPTLTNWNMLIFQSVYLYIMVWYRKLYL